MRLKVLRLSLASYFFGQFCVFSSVVAQVELIGAHTCSCSAFSRTDTQAQTQT